jgi:hypothetical protein
MVSRDSRSGPVRSVPRVGPLLEAVRGGVPAGHGHHPGVVDQEVDRLAGGKQVRGEGRDGPERGEIEGGDANVATEGGGRGAAALRRPDGHEHGVAGGGEGAGGFPADPAVGTGDDGE